MTALGIYTCTVARMLGIHDDFSESRMHGTKWKSLFLSEVIWWDSRQLGLTVGLRAYRIFINFNVFRLEAGGQCNVTNGSDLYCVKIDA